VTVVNVVNVHCAMGMLTCPEGAQLEAPTIALLSQWLIATKATRFAPREDGRRFVRKAARSCRARGSLIHDLIAIECVLTHVP
jgi:hypothetical protein